MLSEDELAGVPLLVFCNKQDVEGALKPEEISEKLGLAGGETKREWSVRGSCATKGEGLEAGLDWYVPLSFELALFPVSSSSVVNPTQLSAYQLYRLVNAIQKK
jgi:signal recognition particle receptor subunit beta